MKPVRVSVVQAAPVLFDKAATSEKVVELIRQVRQEKSQLALFPEAFIPAYPRGFSFGMKIGSRSEPGRLLYERYWNNAIEVPGPETDMLAETAKEADLFLSIGVIEREGDFGRGTLFCTQLYFDPRGNFMGKHRKLKPTGSERLIWGEGDGSTLPVFNTSIGRIGGLTCWENYMPLARMAMYGKGVQIYMAPTADSRETWQATVRHIACEGRCFVLGCNQYVTRDMYPRNLETIEELDDQPEEICPGGSVIVSPFGDILAGPVFGSEDILTADLDFSLITRGKLDFDVAGHYARPDVFQLTVNEKGAKPVKFE
ncbi:carbon-nitrogen hydrolase family protein [Desulfospira joergensenii]|uniref:carbon-nitrogen hydrolase family protein n=1 Tax=Desulfospira joergensenii TaxID=53329 RepID=UPI0003B44E71|nr:carbon-nitrogen hydrolase family protein [Desulfospira joergensenii]